MVFAEALLCLVGEELFEGVAREEEVESAAIEVGNGDHPHDRRKVKHFFTSEISIMEDKYTSHSFVA